MEKQIYTMVLTRNEREALQRVVEAEGHRSASTWLRQIIRQADPQRKEQQANATMQTAR